MQKGILLSEWKLSSPAHGREINWSNRNPHPNPPNFGEQMEPLGNSLFAS